jgi:hypothetical protein
VSQAERPSDFVRTVWDKKTATELSEITHGYSRTWDSARDAQTLNTYIDQIADEEFNKREQDRDIWNREILAACKSVK